MSSASEMTSLPRSTVALWVHREEQRSGSRMATYEVIADSIGKSKSWVRKFYRGSPEVKEASWSLGCRILEAYELACERLDRVAETEQAEARNLQRQINAVIAGVNEVVEGEARAHPRRSAIKEAPTEG